MTLHRLRTAACAGLLAACLAGLPAEAQQNAVRPEVGKPLQAAAALVKARKGRDALAEVAKAEAVPNRTPNENFMIQQMKGSAANAAGDYDTAIAAFESVLNSGRVSGGQASEMEKAVAVAYYQKKDYAKAGQWSQRYFKDGGSDPAIREMLLQSYYLGNDCASVNRIVAADESRNASEKELQMVLNCYQRQRDNGGYVATMERLVLHFPKKEYWTDLLARVQKKPGFSDRLALHVYRLRLATGNLASTNDYMEMAQLALQAGIPAEAKQVVDKGYEVKVLGTGKEAERHQRLRDLVARDLAESQKNRAKDEQGDGNDLVRVGMNYVFEGKADKGISLIEQGIKKGGLKRPDDAKLTLGEAQIIGGQRSRGVQTLRTVQGSDGTADMARLWVLNARA